MAVKGISVLNEERFNTSKTAMLTGVTIIDKYRIGDLWYDIKEKWQHGLKVDEFDLGKRFPFAVGDTVRISSLNEVVGYIRITGIEMVNHAELTEADFQALGYTGRDDYQTSGDKGDRRGWLLRIIHVSPDTESSSNDE